MGSAFLLLSYYYVFVSKCCNNNLHLINLLRWFSVLRARHFEEPFIAFSSPTIWNRGGLDDSIIRDIPTFQFKREGDDDEEEEMMSSSIYGGCVVCLNEFQEQDMIRVLPNCNHEFHLDCVDIWLQTNANCPLCRTSISGTTTRNPIDQIIAPRSSPQEGSYNQNGDDESLMGGDDDDDDEDFVVIELGGGEEDEQVLFSPHDDDGQQQQQERENSNEVFFEQTRTQSPKKTEQKYHHHGNFLRLKNKRQHVSIMGDECIDVIRGKDDDHSIQPIRRSFSLDSAADRQLYYITVRAIVQQNENQRQVSNSSSSNNEECSSRVCRSFFPFGQATNRGSRNAVLPIEFEF